MFHMLVIKLLKVVEQKLTGFFKLVRTRKFGSWKVSGSGGQLFSLRVHIGF